MYWLLTLLFLSHCPRTFCIQICHLQNKIIMMPFQIIVIQSANRAMHSLVAGDTNSASRGIFCLWPFRWAPTYKIAIFSKMAETILFQFRNFMETIS
jgi:hypothetical protein